MPPETDFDPEIRAKRVQHLSEEGAIKPDEADTAANEEIETRMVESRRRATLEKLYADGAITPEAFLRLGARERHFLLLDEDRRQAHQMNKLIEEQRVSTFEASDFSREEFDQTLKEDFEPDYWQDYHHPERTEKKRPGQKAEKLAVDVISRTFQRLELGDLTIQQASAALDQSRLRIDLLLSMPELPEPLHIQATLNRNEEAIAGKLDQLRGTKTILVFLPQDIAYISKVWSPRYDAVATSFVLRQVHEALAQRPDLAPACGRLSEALVTIKSSIQKRGAAG